MADLNRLILPESGWVLSDTTDIQDDGSILARGVGTTGTTHLLLLTPNPVPEPGTLALWGMVVTPALLRLCRRPAS